MYTTFPQCAAVSTDAVSEQPAFDDINGVEFADQDGTDDSDNPDI